jgi:hypothetical protein
MNTYTSHGHRPYMAESMSDAAERFASIKARKRYGKRGYCRTCTIQSWSQDNTLGEYSSFIGYSTGRNETTGCNVNFTVYIK